MLSRQREKMIHPLEMAVDYTGQRLSYPQARAMVKRFSRPAAGQEVKASDVRPVSVLMKTLRYLLTNVCTVKDVPWALVYQFVYDRLQAIRQDLCVQGVRNVMALQIYQAAARFYVYAHYRTCEHNLKDFDPYLNRKQLIDTLFLVMSLYEELESKYKICASSRADFEDLTCDHYCEESDDDSNDESRADEGEETKIVQDSQASEKYTSATKEFLDDTEKENAKSSDRNTESHNIQKEETVPSRRKDRTQNSKSVMSFSSFQEEAAALYLLVNLGNEEAIMNVLKLHKNIRCSKLVDLTLRMNLAWLNHNYYRLLKLSTLLPPLLQCAFHPHHVLIQRKFLCIINQSHGCKGQGQFYCLKELSEMLLYNSTDELAEAADHYGLAVKDEGVIFTKGKFNYETSLIKATRSKRIDDQLATITMPELLFPSLSH